MVYRVWYWLGEREENTLDFMDCGNDGRLAFKVADSCHNPYNNYHPSYQPWIEFEKEVKHRRVSGY